MASTSFSAIADLNLWIKSQANDKLTLADVPELIPFRWLYIRDNWETKILPDLLGRLKTFPNPSLLKNQLDSFTKFVDNQRISATNINPLSSSDIFYRNYLVFDAIEVDSAPVNAAEQAIIDKNMKRVDNFVKTDFVNIKNAVLAARDELADTVGSTDVSYNQTYHRSPIAATVPISIQAVSQMQIYNNTIKNVEFIISNIFSLDTVFVDPFALARANANNPEFDMAAYTSGRLVKLHYGEDLKQLAYRYLGSEDKFIDIAIANGLKPPYVDEVGQKLSLLSNGAGNQINIAMTDPEGGLNEDKFYINQVVILQSDTERFPDQRTVVNIKQIPVSGELVIELSGEANLGIYKIADNANVRVFKPSTINSNFLVLIPSTDGTPDAPSEVPYFLKTKGEDEKKAKVDLLLDENGDLNFNSTGDLQLSFGITNAIQAIKLKLLIEQGSLTRHPEFGFVIMQGTRNSDSALNKSTIVQSLNSQIEADSRFDRVERLDVTYFGTGSGPSGYSIDLVVRMAGSNAPLPISFSVNMS